MIIGVRAHDYGRQEIRPLFRAIAGDGWGAVQLAFTKAAAGIGSFGDVTPELVKETGAALAETGLRVAVLGAYVEPSLAEEAARKRQAAILLGALPQAAALHAGCVATETTAMRSQPGVTRGEALRALRRTLEELLPEAERLGVTVAAEPVWHHALATPELARELLGEMRSPALKLIFDPVNLLHPGNVDAQDELFARAAGLMGGDIAAVHIKGASRETDQNGVLLEAPLRSSIVDYRALAARLGPVTAPVLREHALPETAGEDIAFIRGLWE